MLAILKAKTKKQLAFKIQTIQNAWICFLQIVQDTFKIHPQLKQESLIFKSWL